MQAETYFQEGNLGAALEALQNQIRSHPDNSRYRIFLFQLLVILGQWDRALNQLNVINDMEQSAWSMVGPYREAIRCEMLRTEIFAGRRKPVIFGDPPQWMAYLLEALRMVAEARYDPAKTLRDQAFEMARESSGTIDGQPFAWIADADTRLGPVLEVILNGRYYWLPFEQIKAMQISGVEDLRDLVWLPAHFTWVNGGDAFGLIPSRYPGSESVQDSAIQLARKTEWIELAEGVLRGVGQRMLTTDQGDYPLLDIRDITLT
jgi:type VI secretion system protein ImpE